MEDLFKAVEAGNLGEVVRVIETGVAPTVTNKVGGHWGKCGKDIF